MKTFFESYKRNSDGASAVEFALLAPIFILMIVGTVDMGMYVLQKTQLHNTVHTSAVYVARAADDESLQTIAQETHQGNFEDITVTSAFECECADGAVLSCPASCGSDDYQRRYVLVSGTGSYSSLFPYPGIPQSITISTQSRVRVD